MDASDDLLSKFNCSANLTSKASKSVLILMKNFFPRFGNILLHLSVVAQSYKVDVETLAASRGCTAILRCVVPSFVKELVRVVSWVQEPAFFIYPSLQGGERENLRKLESTNSSFRKLQMENIICCQAESF